MTTLQVKQVNKQGQISIGKKFAGKTIRIDEYADGTIVLKPVEIISEFEMCLLKDEAFHKGAVRLIKTEKSKPHSNIFPLHNNLQQQYQWILYSANHRPFLF